jgi:hypothetical protein
MPRRALYGLRKHARLSRRLTYLTTGSEHQILLDYVPSLVFSPVRLGRAGCIAFRDAFCKFLAFVLPLAINTATLPRDGFRKRVEQMILGFRTVDKVQTTLLNPVGCQGCLPVLKAQI